MSNNVAEIILKLDDRVSKGLGVVGSKLEDTVSKLEKIEQQSKAFEKLRTGALVAGTAIAVGLGLATAKAVQFESALAPVKTVLSGTADEVQQTSERIGKNALAWSSKYKNSSEEYLGASYNLLSAGLNEQQAIAGTNMALKLATATLGDATTSSALLGTLYNNFGNKANDANQEMLALSDTVAKTQQLFQIANLGQLNEGLKYASSSALSFNVSFAQTSAVVGQLNTLGITGSMAGTSFNAMMRTLNKGSQELGYTVERTADGGIDLVRTLRNISEVGASADVIQKVFGDEGAKGINLLTAKIGELEGNLLEVENSSGSTEEAFNKIFKTSGYQLDILKNNFANLGVNIGKPIQEALMRLLVVLNPILEGFNNFLAQNQWLAKIIAVVSGALAGLLLAFASYVFWIKSATMVTGIWTAITTMATTTAGAMAGAMIALNTAIYANPIGAIVVGVIALIAGIVLLVKNWDKVLLAIKAVWNFIVNFIPNTINLLKKVRDTIAVVLVRAWDSMVVAWNNGITKIKAMWESFKMKALVVWDSIVSYAEAVWENIKAIFTIEWWLELGNKIRSIFDQVFSFEFWKEQFQNMLHSILGSVGKWWENIKKIARGQQIVEDDPLEQVVEQERKILIDTEYTEPTILNRGILNNDLPQEHRDFLAKNGYMRTIESMNIVAPAGTNTKDKSFSTVQRTSDITTIHIDKVEIGHVANFEDFILQLQQRALA
ncbi:MAG: phage tail tape measure protein [Brevinema sp.]